MGSSRQNIGSRNIVYQYLDNTNAVTDTADGGSRRFALSGAGSRNHSLKGRDAASAAQSIFENQALGNSYAHSSEKSHYRPGLGRKKQARKPHSRGLSRHQPRNHFNVRTQNFDMEALSSVRGPDPLTALNMGVTEGDLARPDDEHLQRLKDLRHLRQMRSLRKQSIEQQRTIERRERKSIFEKVSDNNANRLIAGYAYQEVQETREDNRRMRARMLDQIQLVEKELRQRRRDIERQKGTNTDIRA